jgi:hypothetical protein
MLKSIAARVLPRTPFARRGALVCLGLGLAACLAYPEGRWSLQGLIPNAHPALGGDAAEPGGIPYKVTTHRYSYFKIDGSGAYEMQGGHLFRSEGMYDLERTIDPRRVAIIVMDPWIDMETAHLNEHFGSVAARRVVPLVHKGLERGHRVIVLTNDPAAVTYNTKINPELAALAESGKLRVLYHQNLDDDQFAEMLRKEGIDSLLYVGFASNMCVIGRKMGMIPMVQQGFKTYFVPEASAAVEFAETWETQSVHRETTKIISQWIAEILHYDDFMQARSVE